MLVAEVSRLTSDDPVPPCHRETEYDDCCDDAENAEEPLQALRLPARDRYVHPKKTTDEIEGYQDGGLLGVRRRANGDMEKSSMELTRTVILLRVLFVWLPFKR